MKRLLLKWAVGYLLKQLKKDKDLWYAYQSNIAMTIQDNLIRRFPTKKNLNDFCNKCANDFLNIWTKKT
jgi:hypothetical protein